MSQKAELQSNNTDLQTILSKVNGLPDQLVLPTLKNPAGAGNIEAGYQAIDGSGNLIEGTKKLVVGSKTVSQNTSITISELAGAENFILALAGNIPKGSQYRFVTSIIKTGSTIKTYSPSSYYVVDDYSSYMAFDSATGKFTGSNLYFGGSTYSYVAW